MRSLGMAGLLMGPFVPILATAQSDFDGTWKIDLGKSVMTTEHDVLLLQDGIYHCKNCIPKMDVKADEQDQNVAGSPCFDTISVRAVDDRTVEQIEKQHGKVVRTSRMTASADWSTATIDFTDSTQANADPVIGKLAVTRVAKSKRPQGRMLFRARGALKELRVSQITRSRSHSRSKAKASL